MKGIADTGFIIAFGSLRDTYHGWAKSVAKRVQPPLLTCEPVLSEAAFHLRSSAYVLSLVENGLLALSFDCARNMARIQELARRYEERCPDLADLCLIRMSELYPRHTVITINGDFRVYRRNGRESIPALFPPGM